MRSESTRLYVTFQRKRHLVTKTVSYRIITPCLNYCTTIILVIIKCFSYFVYVYPNLKFIALQFVTKNSFYIFESILLFIYFKNRNGCSVYRAVDEAFFNCLHLLFRNIFFSLFYYYEVKDNYAQ